MHLLHQKTKHAHGPPRKHHHRRAQRRGQEKRPAEEGGEKENVQTIEERQGLGVGCIEAVAYTRGFINDEQLEKLAQPLMKSGYGNYLLSLLH